MPVGQKMLWLVDTYGTHSKASVDQKVLLLCDTYGVHSDAKNIFNWREELPSPLDVVHSPRAHCIFAAVGRRGQQQVQIRINERVQKVVHRSHSPTFDLGPASFESSNWTLKP